MKKFKILVVEDNYDQLQIFKTSIQLFSNKFEIDNIVYAETCEELIEVLKSYNKFDISFLDILLDEGMTIYDVLKIYGVEPFGQIIFNSTDDVEMKKLDDFNVLGKYIYLNSKYTPKSLTKAINEIDFNKLNSNDNRIYLTDVNKNNVIPVDIASIFCICVKDNYSFVWFLENNEVKSVMLYKQLKDVLEYLRPLDLIRINKSFAINIKYIEKLDRSFNRVKLIYPINDSRLDSDGYIQVHHSYKDSFLSQVKII